MSMKLKNLPFPPPFILQSSPGNFMRVNFILTLTVLAFHPFATAHETFLRPDDHYIHPNTPSQIRLFTGKFDRSIFPISETMIADLFLQSDSGNEPITPEDWETITSGSWTWSNLQKVTAKLGGVDLRDTGSFTLQPLEEGSFTLVMELYRARVAIDTPKFLSYLHEEAYSEMDIQALGFTGEGEIIQERYTKHAKAIIQVGNALTSNVTEPTGQTIEIIPQRNPAEVKKGEELEFLVLLNNAPLTNQSVMAGRGKGAFEKAENLFAVYKTDNAGRFSLPITDNGNWWANAIWITPQTTQDDVDFVSEWASLTFEIK